MVDCPAIDTHSVALKGSLRHQWINSYSYASIHHPPPFSSGRSTPSTLSLWIFWGFEHNPTNPPFSQKSPHLFQKKKKKKVCAGFSLNLFHRLQTFVVHKMDSQHFHIDHCGRNAAIWICMAYRNTMWARLSYRKDISTSNLKLPLSIALVFKCTGCWYIITYNKK